MNNLKDHIVPVVGFILILLSAYLYNRIEEANGDIKSLFILISLSVLLYVFLLSFYTWNVYKPHEKFAINKKILEEMHCKINASVERLVQKERFIDQNLLGLIEKQAQNIWVITTELANEINDIDLQKAVEENLSNGKRYTYFIPHPESVHYEALSRRIPQFKQLDLYKKFNENISFIHLPRETLFLLKEVVIYNPEKDEITGNETEGINGFTYYESHDEDNKQLHMKIEGDLLKNLANTLHTYLQNGAGIRAAITELLANYSDKLRNQEKLYLYSQIETNKHSILEDSQYNSFIDSIEKNKRVSENDQKVIIQVFSRFLTNI